MGQKVHTPLSHHLFSAACVASIIGIWPRFIEPKWLTFKSFRLKVPRLPPPLDGLTVLQLSDLHFQPGINSRFLKKIHKKVQALKPDLIVYTGDLLCDAQMHQPDRLLEFLSHFRAPYGCYAILGNHDYANTIDLNGEGDYALASTNGSFFAQTLNRLFTTAKVRKNVTKEVQDVPLHTDLVALLEKSPFQLLHNATIQVPIKESLLNITGLGELMLGRCLPDVAFEHYDPTYPGIVLTHNPDSIPSLLSYPGEVILAGHTHGGQVYLPWIWKKIAMIDDPKFRYGREKIGGKQIFVSRGLGGTIPFRLFCPPELILHTLEAA